eukprot:12721038-Ditylum_brightwellii.AAC.1
MSGIDVARAVMQRDCHPWCLALQHYFFFFLLPCFVRFVVKEGWEVENGPPCMDKEVFMMAVDKNCNDVMNEDFNLDLHGSRICNL